MGGIDRHGPPERMGQCLLDAAPMQLGLKCRGGVHPVAAAAACGKGARRFHPCVVSAEDALQLAVALLRRHGDLELLVQQRAGHQHAAAVVEPSNRLARGRHVDGQRVTQPRLATAGTPSAGAPCSAIAAAHFMFTRWLVSCPERTTTTIVLVGPPLRLQVTR
jgi:hypothetical protein